MYTPTFHKRLRDDELVSSGFFDSRAASDVRATLIDEFGPERNLEERELRHLGLDTEAA